MRLENLKAGDILKDKVKKEEYEVRKEGDGLYATKGRSHHRLNEENIKCFDKKVTLEHDYVKNGIFYHNGDPIQFGEKVYFNGIYVHGKDCVVLSMRGKTKGKINLICATVRGTKIHFQNMVEYEIPIPKKTKKLDNNRTIGIYQEETTEGITNSRLFTICGEKYKEIDVHCQWGDGSLGSNGNVVAFPVKRIEEFGEWKDKPGSLLIDKNFDIWGYYEIVPKDIEFISDSVVPNHCLIKTKHGNYFDKHTNHASLCTLEIRPEIKYFVDARQKGDDKIYTLCSENFDTQQIILYT